MKIEQTLWIEKYRPSKIEDVVIPDEYVHQIKSFVKNKEIPNLLFFGQPGGGKTTVARILTSPEGVLLKKDNLLALNGSAKETRGINYVNDVIEPFLKIPPAGRDKYRIIFIDEADFLTAESFHSLRGIIEKYQIKYGRFILTCNYLSKVPSAVQSRFTTFAFRQIPIDFVMNYSKSILDNENVEYNENDLRFITEGLYPDVRRIVNALQQSIKNNNLIVNKDIAQTNEKVLIACIIEICNAIKNNEGHKINKNLSTSLGLLDKQDLDFRNIYTKLFNEKQIPIPAKIVINKYSNTHQGCLVPSMHFSSCIFQIIQTINAYYKSIAK